jgi:hypothetical protein
VRWEQGPWAWLMDRMHVIGTVQTDERRRLMMTPTRYARSGDATIAYQVAGEGQLDLLYGATRGHR